jgi:hypothetical protein
LPVVVEVPFWLPAVVEEPRAKSDDRGEVCELVFPFRPEVCELVFPFRPEVATPLRPVLVAVRVPAFGLVRGDRAASAGRAARAVEGALIPREEGMAREKLRP